MNGCVYLSNPKKIFFDSSASIGDARCQYMLLSSDEYSNLMALISVDPSNGNVIDALPINSELYAEVSGYLLLSFLSGHILGRIVKTLSKV